MYYTKLSLSIAGCALAVAVQSWGTFAQEIDDDAGTALTEPCVLWKQGHDPTDEGDNSLWKHEIVCQVWKSTDHGLRSRELSIEVNDAHRRLTENHDITSGSTTLFADGAMVNWSQYTLWIPDDATLQLATNTDTNPSKLFHIDTDPNSVHRRTQTTPKAKTHGEKVILTVRVNGNDVKSIEAEEMRMRMFGSKLNDDNSIINNSGPDDWQDGTELKNVLAAMNRCSAGELTVKMAPDFSPQNSSLPKIQKGLIELNLPQPLDGMPQMELMRTVEPWLKEYLKENGLSTRDYDHIAYALPNNTTEWDGAKGYASMGGAKSVYQSKYFIHSTLMHELGHNFGFDHSNAKLKLKDGTCFMGYGINKACKYEVNYGMSCYNVAKYYFAEWFSERHARTSPLDELSWEGYIAGIASYEADADENPILLRITGNSTVEYTVGLNTATGRNAAVCTYRDRVVVYRVLTQGKKYSFIVAELGAGESFKDPDWDTRGLNIYVNDIETTGEPLANITVYATCSTNSDCQNDDPCDGKGEVCNEGRCVAGSPPDCEAPSAAPSRFCLDSPLLMLENKGNGVAKGPISVVFDVSIHKGMFIKTLYLHLKQDVSHIVTVYTKENTYVDANFDYLTYLSDITQWNLIVNKTAMVGAGDVPMEPFYIDANTTQAFFVTVEKDVNDGGLGTVKYKDNDDQFGDAIQSNDDMSLHSGIKVGGIFGEIKPNKMSNQPYFIRGVVKYHVCDMDKPSKTPAPSAQITTSPSPSYEPPSSNEPTTKGSNEPSVLIEPSKPPSNYPSIKPTPDISSCPKQCYDKVDEAYDFALDGVMKQFRKEKKKCEGDEACENAAKVTKRKNLKIIEPFEGIGNP